MSGRSVLITGCCDGSFGAALALSFSHAGYRVFATASSKSEMVKLRGSGIEGLELDVTSPHSIELCVSQVQKLNRGRLDILVNNAAQGHCMPLLDTGIDDMARVFAVNTWSLVVVTQAFTPLLLKSTRPIIVNNTSIPGAIGLPFEGIYSASKSAASTLTETMRLELNPFDIRVINLVTGGMQSSFFKTFLTGSRSMALTVPENSMYSKAVAFYQKNVGDEHTKEFSLPLESWAKQVVKAVAKEKPLWQIWLGEKSKVSWMASFLPHGFFDGMLKSMTGLDTIEKKIRQERQISEEYIQTGHNSRKRRRT